MHCFSLRYSEVKTLFFLPLNHDNLKNRFIKIYIFSGYTIREIHYALCFGPFQYRIQASKAAKGQVIAHSLAAHPCLDNEELLDDLPGDEIMSVKTKLWQLYFNKTIKVPSALVGVLFVTPLGGLITCSFFLLGICTDNVAEYEVVSFCKNIKKLFLA